jgi:hypothetical protein
MSLIAGGQEVGLFGNTKIELNAPNGSSSNGSYVQIQAGQPDGAGNDGGAIIIKAGSAIAADAASTPGEIELNPGSPYQTSSVSQVYIGDDTYSADTVGIQSKGSQTNVNLALSTKGAGSISLNSASINLYNLKVTDIASVIKVYPSNATYTLEIASAAGPTDTSGGDIKVYSGDGNGVGGGGNLYLYAGTGSFVGNTYFGTGTAGRLLNDETETNIVAYDTATGLLTYRSVSSISGTVPIDNILDWNGTAYAPYAAQSTGNFDSSSTNPISAVNRLNYDGEFYAYNLYAANATDHVTITSGGQVLIYTGGANQMIFQPYVSDGAGAYAYFFDTENTLSTEGSTVARFLSNGTIRFAIHGKGELQVSARSTTGLPTPGVGYGLLYQDSADDKLYFKTSTTTYDLTQTGGAAHASSHEVGGGDLVDHDNLTNFVSNEHINHTSVSITTGASSGLAGGGTIASTRTLTLDVNNLTTITSLAGGDMIPVHDSGVGTRNIAFANFEASLAIPSIGTDNYIPYSNSGGTDFDYSSSFTFSGSLLYVARSSTTTWGSTTNPSVNGVLVENTDTSTLANKYAGIKLEAHSQSGYTSEMSITTLAPTTASHISYMYFMGTDASANWKTIMGLRTGVDVLIYDHHARTGNAWSDYPTALPSRCLLFQRGPDVASEGSLLNDYSGIMINASSASGKNAYGIMAVRSMSTTTHAGAFEFLLRGSGSTDYETIFGMEYTSHYYWKINSSSGDLTHHLRRNGTTTAVYGWDNSTGFQIHTSTGFASTTITADFVINTSGYLFLGNIQNTSNTNYLRYNSTTGEVTWLSSSDVRLKENIKEWNPDSLTFLMNQRLIKYDRKDKSSMGEIGWDATQMEQLMPDMTWRDEKGYVNLKDAHFPLHFHRAIQQLGYKIQRLETLEERVNRLERENVDMRRQILNLKNLGMTK